MTRFLIAKQVGPDSYRTIAGACDGYLEHTGAILLEHYNTPERVDKLLDLGDIYYLGKKMDWPEGTTFEEKQNDRDGTMAFARDFGDVNTAAEVLTLKELDSLQSRNDYVYIFTEANQWAYFKGGMSEQGLLDLRDSGTRLVEAPPPKVVAAPQQRYSSDDRHMTIDITEAGLAEINADAQNANGKLFQGYSNYTARVTYTATVNSDATVVHGENGNCNEVVLTWRRTSSEYYDTLIDDCHFYTFGLDLTKLFSDVDSETAEETGMFKHVKFKLYNDADEYWVTAARDEATGIYYVTGHVTEESDATIFHPVTSGDKFGQIIIKGLEDDWYTLTEVETANGYTLLQDDIYVDIYAYEDDTRICDIYSKDALGVLQNDPHYCFGKEMALSLTDADGGFDLSLTGIPQKYLEHTLLSAYAQVDENDVVMLADGESANALAPLTVVNTRGFDLPQTGDTGTWMYSVVGITLMAGAMIVILLTFRKKEKEQTAQQ